jgi:hypothetical protein
MASHKWWMTIYSDYYHKSIERLMSSSSDAIVSSSAHQLFSSSSSLVFIDGEKGENNIN